MKLTFFMEPQSVILIFSEKSSPHLPPPQKKKKKKNSLVHWALKGQNPFAWLQNQVASSYWKQFSLHAVKRTQKTT